MTENKEEQKSLLLRMKEESEKAGLKHIFQKTKIMASGPITSWQIDGKKWKLWHNFLGSNITVNFDSSHKIKRSFLPGRKTMTNLDNVLKSRDIILPTMVCIVKLWFFQ